MLEQISFYFSVDFVPVLFGFWAGRVNNFFLFQSLRNSQSVFSQKRPIFCAFLLLHDNFDWIKSVNSFWFWRDDLAEQFQIQMIVSSCLNWEVNDNSIIVKFNMKIVFVFNGVWNFNTDFGWSLIPCVCDFIVLAYSFLSGHVFLPQGQNISLSYCFKLGLLNPFKKIWWHILSKSMIYDIFIKVFIKKIVNPENSYVNKFLAYLYFLLNLKKLKCINRRL